MNAEDIRARLAGFNPDKAREQEAKGSHAQNRKFAPPWYELFHFRATLHLEGIEPNRNGIDQVVFSLESPEVYETNSKTQQTQGDRLFVTLPKEMPGYPTDEINLMVDSLRAHMEAPDITAFDGLDVEMELDYEDHPFQKELGQDKTPILINGVEIPRRCWYYKTIAVFGNANVEKAPATPNPENVKKLAEWCVGKSKDEVNHAALARAAIGLGVQSDSALMGLLTDGPTPFLTHAATVGLGVEDGKFVLV